MKPKSEPASKPTQIIEQTELLLRWIRETDGDPNHGGLGRMSINKIIATLVDGHIETMLREPKSRTGLGNDQKKVAAFLGWLQVRDRAAHRRWTKNLL